MWIEETKDGKYKYVERYEDYLTGKQKKVSVTMDKNTAQSRKLAQASLNAKIAEKLSESSPAAKKNLTLKELVELYRENQKKMIKVSTYRTVYHSTITTLRIFGEDTLVNRITAKYLRDTLIATGERNSTLNNHLKRIKAVLRWGYKNDYVNDISYLLKVDFFPTEIEDEPTSEGKYLESHELNYLLTNIRLSKWRDLTEFLALSGLRIGEALALTYRDVDLKKRTISITKTCDMREGYRIDTPKNVYSIRTIYIQDELLSLCTRLKRDASTNYLVNRCNHLFQDQGEVLNYNAYNEYLKKYTKKYIGRELTPHSLRHTHASLLLEQGLSIEVISRRLGHESIAITQKVYAHVTQKLRERDYESISKICIL